MKTFEDKIREGNTELNKEVKTRREEILKKNYDDALEAFVKVYNEIEYINVNRLFTGFFNFLYYAKGEEGELNRIDEKSNEIETKIEEVEANLMGLKKSLSNLKNNGKILASLRAYERETKRKENERENELDRKLTKALKE